jgi:hypothetical protein
VEKFSECFDTCVPSIMHVFFYVCQMILTYTHAIFLATHFINWDDETTKEEHHVKTTLFSHLGSRSGGGMR